LEGAFELIRFQVTPAGGAVAVIELEGRHGDPGALAGRPVLLLEGPVEEAELQAIVEPYGGDDGILCATFAAPLELAVDPETTFALAIGRGPIVELPVPDGADGTGLEVRLARTVNALREELHETREQIGERELAAEREGASAARDAARAAAAAERERLERELAEANEELAELRHELLEASWRVTELEAAVVPKAPRPPRPPRPHPPRAPRERDETAEHERVERTNHRSLGRSTGRTIAFVVVALVVAVVLVVLLGVQLVD
jgi:hypothetical protein